MTKKEWQLLARETKNNGTYYQLIWSIKHFANRYFLCDNMQKVERWQRIIENNSYRSIKDWYQKHFYDNITLDVNQ